MKRSRNARRRWAKKNTRNMDHANEEPDDPDGGWVGVVSQRDEEDLGEAHHAGCHEEEQQHLPPIRKAEAPVLVPSERNAGRAERQRAGGGVSGGAVTPRLKRRGAERGSRMADGKG